MTTNKLAGIDLDNLTDIAMEYRVAWLKAALGRDENGRLDIARSALLAAIADKAPRHSLTRDFQVTCRKLLRIDRLVPLGSSPEQHAQATWFRDEFDQIVMSLQTLHEVPSIKFPG